MTTITVAVSKLAHSPRNVRQPSEDDDTGDLEGTILELGLINPLTAHPMPRGKYGVFAGGRRLLALQRLIRRGDLPKDHAVDVTVRDESDAKLTELSFAENAVRQALPAVTEFETYARLIDEGAEVAAIAHRYQTTELHVRQRMRLGELHPAIRADLAAEKLTLDMAKAYGATADQALQKRIYDQRPTHPYEVRAAMKRDAANAGIDRMLALVGLDAYAAAGGRAEEDLFTPGESRVLDVEILRAAYNERIEAERDRLGIPAQATLQFGFDGVGAVIEQPAALDDAAWTRVATIDGEVEDLECKLDDVAEWNDDGPIGRYIAVAGGDQGEVDRLAADLKRLRDESETIHRAAAGTIDGPVIAVADAVNLQLFLRSLHRPIGWSDAGAVAPPVAVTGSARATEAAIVAGVAAATPVLQRTVTALGGTAAVEKPVVNGFRPDRLAYSGVYRQPEEVAKERYGLTKDAVEAMRSHQRRTLQAALLGSPIGEKLAGTFLVFVLARDLLRERGPDDYRVDSAGQLGVDRVPSIEHDPHQVRADLAAQPAAEIVGDALARLRAAEWMREPDIAAAFRRFSHTPFIEQQRAAAAVAAAMLNRSLGLPGFEVPIHQVLAEFLSIGREVRSYWSPDAAFFARLSKTAKLDAIRFVDEAVAKRVTNLGTDDLTEAAAAIMSGTLAAASKYGLSDEARRRADGWVPDYLAFLEPDEPADDADVVAEAAE